MPTTFDSATIATVADVQNRIDSLPSAPKGDTLIADANRYLALLKSDYLKRDIQIWIRKKYPRTVDDWITRSVGLYNATLKQLKSRYATADLNQIVQFAGTDLVPFSLITQYEGTITKPCTYYLGGTPSTDFQGSATNGDYLVDTAHRVLYINRSTSGATVNWQRYTSDDLIDRVLSYAPFKVPLVTGTVWLMLQNGALKLRATQTANDKVDEAATAWKEMYDEDLAKALELIDIDESGDGIISSYEAGVNESDEFIW